ncbi:MAG: restriction endonuclease [Anaerolineae bacterium]|nr:restriction endonuclease [Anaerolineae bacterium]
MASKIDNLLGLEPWRAYERAMFNDLYYRFRSPAYVVKPDIRDIVGRLSLAKRQVDVAVFHSNDMGKPFLIVECKRYTTTKLDVNDVGEFVSRFEDTGAEHGVLVSPLGFSLAAQNLAKAKGVWLLELKLQEANRLNWREVARALYPWDEIFHQQMGDVLYAVLEQRGKYLDRLEEIAFEEWEATLLGIYRINPEEGEYLLRTIAQTHYDDSWRFNAIRLLDEIGCLDAAFRETLMEYESDPETLQLLNCH